MSTVGWGIVGCGWVARDHLLPALAVTPGARLVGACDRDAVAAARDHVRIVNGPGSSLAETPALAAFLPNLARRLLGEDLALPSAQTVWLGDAAAREAVLRNPTDWRLRPAFEGAVPAVALATADERGAHRDQRRGPVLVRACWSDARSAGPVPAPCRLSGAGARRSAA